MSSAQGFALKSEPEQDKLGLVSSHWRPFAKRCGLFPAVMINHNIYDLVIYVYIIKYTI